MTQPGLATSSVLSCDFSHESLPSGAFFSLRCLIYKVHAVLGGTLLLYQTSFRLSRTFFRKFFDARSVSYHQQLFKFTIPFSLCQELFSKFFRRGISIWPLSPPLSRRRGAHRADSFVRIPDHPPFVNGFLQVFSFFE